MGRPSPAVKTEAAWPTVYRATRQQTLETLRQIWRDQSVRKVCVRCSLCIALQAACFQAGCLYVSGRQLFCFRQTACLFQAGCLFVSGRLFKICFSQDIVYCRQAFCSLHAVFRECFNCQANFLLVITLLAYFMQIVCYFILNVCWVYGGCLLFSCRFVTCII